MYRQWKSLHWLSLLGDSLYYIALISYASNFANPALSMTIISISEIFPRVFQILLGALADSAVTRTKYFFHSGIVRGMIYLMIGFLIMSGHSLWIVILIGILNAISDTFGSFVDLCIDPFIKFVVKEDEYEEAIAVNAVFENIIMMAAGFVGAFLLGFMTIHNLAFFNAVTFFIVAVGVRGLKSKFETIESKINPVHFSNISDLFKHIIESIKELLKIKSIRNFFIYAACLNSIVLTSTPVITLYLSLNMDQQIRNIAFSTALIQGVTVAISLLGSMLGPKFFAWLKTKTILFLAFFGNSFFLIGLLVEQIWIGIAIMMIGVFAIGIFNIRFSAIILKNVPAEKMGTINASMGTFFSVFPSLLSTIFISLAGVSVLIYILISLVFCGVLMFSIFKDNTEETDFSKI